MNSKGPVFVGTIIGSTIGSLIPSFLGADMFSFSSLIFGSIGAIIGIYIGFKLSNE